MDTRLDHVRANVADLRRAVEWYTTVLGFEVDSTWPPDRPDYAHFKSAGGATFAVMEAEGHSARFNWARFSSAPAASARLAKQANTDSHWVALLATAVDSTSSPGKLNRWIKKHRPRKRFGRHSRTLAQASARDVLLDPRSAFCG